MEYACGIFRDRLAGKVGAILENEKTSARQVALMGLLFALAIALAFLENLLPSFVPVPGIKLGLSNVVTMYCVFLMGRGRALTLAVLKALFTLLTRGLIASLLSLSGGVLSVVVMVLLLALAGGGLSYSAASMAGAVVHNLGQLTAAALLLRLGAVLWYYLPVLVISGIVMGLLTGILLRTVLPYLPGTVDRPAQTPENEPEE